jgi:hypothetical protein
MSLPFRKSAGVYSVDERLVIMSESRNTDEGSQVNGHYRVLRTRDLAAIGGALLEMLTCSEDHAPSKVGHKVSDFVKILNSLGFKTNTAFMKSAKCVNVSKLADASELDIVPMINVGRYFVPNEGEEFQVPSQVSDIGLAVLKGLDLSK